MLLWALLVLASIHNNNAVTDKGSHSFSIIQQSNIKHVYLLYYFSKPDAFTQPLTVKKPLDGCVMEIVR